MAYGPVIDPEVCIGCNRCYDQCPMDVFQEAETSGGPPRVRYPDECWYCGSCFMVCPTNPQAVTLIFPLNMRLALRRVN
jgi:NAD-dependent dihydropyrimidine dehydrogenase PreA subunit